MLIDSTVLIDFLRGRSLAERFVRQAIADEQAFLHPVVEAELLAGARDAAEQRAIDMALSSLVRTSVTATDVDESLRLMRELRLSRGIGWHDCLLASSAARLGEPVATLNVKHFASMPGLKVHRPY